MAPEQLNTKKYGINDKISFNLDLWSLGVTIYEVISGKILFKNSDQDSPEQIMANIMAPELPEKINELPEPFRSIVSHCIVKDAKERAQKAEELIVLLHGNYSEEPVIQPAAEIAPAWSNTEKIAVKNPVEATERVPKTFFYIDKPKDEKITPSAPLVTRMKDRSKKLIFFHRMAVLAAVLLIATITYLFTRDNKKAEAKTVPIKKADSTRPLPIPPVMTQDKKLAQDSGSGEKPAPPREKSVPTRSQLLPPTEKNEAVEKKSKKNKDLAKDQKHQEQITRTTKNQKYILELATTETCTVKINDDDYGVLASGKPMKVYLIPGKYIIQATSTANSSKIYRGNLEVTQENLSQVGQFKIPFK
jgi:serine/threonine protein kinase